MYSGISEQRTLWDQYKFKWFVPCIEVVLFKRFQSLYIDRGDKIWGFSFVHCGEVFNTVSLSRSGGSTVHLLFCACPSKVLLLSSEKASHYCTIIDFLGLLFFTDAGNLNHVLNKIKNK